MSDVQSLLDDLCARLGRSAAIDNEFYEFVAVSAGLGESDRAREESVLQRHTSPEIVAFIAEQRLDTASKPVRVPGSDRLQSLPRWAFPLRTSTHHFGYLWIIDSPALTDEEFELTHEAALRIRDAFTVTQEHARATQRASVNLARALITEGHADALVQADRAGLLHSLGPVQLWSFTVEPEPLRRPHALTMADLTELLAALHASMRAGSFIGMPYQHRITLVTRMPGGQTDPEYLALHRAVARACGRLGLQLTACGTATLAPGEDPADTHERAIFAASVALWEGHALPLDWSGLGAWTLLLRVPLGDEQVKMISPAAFELIQHGQPMHWETLLSYLDCAGDIAATCTALHVQRATLYYRLKRIREIAGDRVLTEGWERSSAHLALRLWRACIARAAADGSALTSGAANRYGRVSQAPGR